MRWFFIVFFIICLLFVGLMGFRGQRFSDRPFMVFLDMDVQPKVMPQKPTDFFADGMGMRKPVTNTLPMGFAVRGEPVMAGGEEPLTPFAISDSYYSTGRYGDYYGSGFPQNITVDEALLERGRQRFNIYCSVCHGESGNGKGAAGPFWLGGMLPPTANLVDGRVAVLPEGQIFDTITNGRGLMGPYGGNVLVPDRWAIVAYLKALQVSQKPDLTQPAVQELIQSLQAPPAAVEGAPLPAPTGAQPEQSEAAQPAETPAQAGDAS